MRHLANLYEIFRPAPRAENQAAADAGREAPLLASSDRQDSEDDLLDVLEQVGERVTALQVSSMPSAMWLTGALGSSMLSAGMAYTVKQGGSQVELRLAQTAAVAGTGMYFSGQQRLLAKAWAAQTSASMAQGLCVPLAAMAVMAGACLLGAQGAAAQTSGLIVSATGISAISYLLSEEFVLAHGALGHSAGDAARNGGRFVSWGLGCGAALLALGMVWAAGFAAKKLGYTAAMGTACAGGFSACLGSSVTLSWKLWELRRCAPHVNAAVASAAVATTPASSDVLATAAAAVPLGPSEREAEDLRLVTLEEG